MYRMERWVLLYSKAEHGTSINTLYSKVDSAPKSNAKVNNLTRAFHSSSNSNLAGISSVPSPPGSSINLNTSSAKPYLSSYPSGNFTFHGHGSVCVLLIKDTNGSIFGCYTTERWHIPATVRSRPCLSFFKLTHRCTVKTHEVQIGNAVATRISLFWGVVIAG